MTYKVFIIKKAQKELATLPKQEYYRVKSKIESLGDNPRPFGCKKLTGRDAWRIRVGNYRILYEIRDDILTVTVFKISHRKSAYD